jgi:hypothetical protein
VHAVDEGVGRDDREMRTRRLPNGGIVADTDDERRGLRPPGSGRLLDDRAQRRVAGPSASARNVRSSSAGWA